MARILKEEEYALRRDEILHSTQRLVYTRGYEQMSIKDILDDLHISKGAFYHYFNSKQDLLEALINRMLAEAAQLLNPILEDPDRTALEKLKIYFSTASNWKTGQKEYLLKFLHIWYDDNNAIVRQKLMVASNQQLIPILAKVIQQGVDEHVFHLQYPDQVAKIVMMLVQGLGDTFVDLLILNESDGQLALPIEETISTYTEAVERVLGAAPGSIQIMEPQLIKRWFARPESAPHGGQAKPAKVKGSGQ